MRHIPHGGIRKGILQKQTLCVETADALACGTDERNVAQANGFTL
jgi:hypothetical protein